MDFNIQILRGPWRTGRALDLHSSSSKSRGGTDFDTDRTEIGEMLYRFKYQNDASKLRPLADACAEFLRLGIIAPDFAAIIPMPPSVTDIHRRESQPVYELAKLIGRAVKVRVDCDYLVKVQVTPEVKNKTPKEKQALLGSAFEIDKKRRRKYRDKKVLIFDDLYDSGATMTSAARALIADGLVEDVYVLTVTKTRTGK